MNNNNILKRKLNNIIIIHVSDTVPGIFQAKCQATCQINPDKSRTLSEKCYKIYLPECHGVECSRTCGL